jgi:hypothetical protein
LTCRWRERGPATATKGAHAPRRQPKQGRCQRARPDGATLGRKGHGALRPDGTGDLAFARECPSRTVSRSVGPKPAARRQARGCRRLDDRKVVRRRSRTRQCQSSGRSRRRTPAGLPTALGGRSPKVKSRRVHVARDVGCRSGVRGILVPPPRKAARPHEGTAPSDGRGPRPGRGPWSSSSRQRCSDARRAARPGERPSAAVSGDPV